MTRSARDRRSLQKRSNSLGRQGEPRWDHVPLQMPGPSSTDLGRFHRIRRHGNPPKSLRPGRPFPDTGQRTNGPQRLVPSIRARLDEAAGDVFGTPCPTGTVIVAETPSAYRFITQPAHARLAGQFAERWGRGEFRQPEPYAAVVTATTTHDDGWRRYDHRPHLDDAGRPIGFTDLPAGTWIEIYDRGIDAVIETDRYAGLLVSMHGTGLRRRRYGLSPDWPDTPPAFRTFVERQEARQDVLLETLRADETDERISATDAALLTALHENGAPPAATTSRLWWNYVLLQAWDALSLAFCRTMTPPATDVLSLVPRRPGGDDTSLRLTELVGRGIAVDPYPFDIDPLEVTVTARTVAKSAFETEADLVDRYRRVGPDDLTFTLTSP